MSTPNFFKISSKSNKSSGSSSPPDAPPDAEENSVSQSLTGTFDSPIPNILSGIWTRVDQELAQAQGSGNLLNKIADVQSSVTLSPGQQTVVGTLIAPVTASMDTSLADNIRKGVDTLGEAVPVIMNVLDEVADVHPFIKVVVLAFKAAYILETTRRENDKTLLALYVEMKDMMIVLAQLKGVNDPEMVAPDGQTIKGRMGELCKAAAQDIRECANACDAYRKKKPLVKVIGGSLWEGKLVKFVKVFAKRQEDFRSALAIHTAVGVDAVRVKLNIIHEREVALDQKMDIILKLFRELVPPEQKKLEARVERMGGRDTVLKDEKLMKELASEDPGTRMPTRKNAPATRSGSGSDNRHGTDRPFNFIELKREIESTPDAAIEKNLEYFNGKFDHQEKRFKEAMERMERMFTREGDRVISAVTAGPHDRISDPDIRDIWKDMRWRGSVKARDFVMELKEYYTEKGVKDSNSPQGPDSWAIKHISISRARSILEAFDDDFSGFVTVNEVNNLIRSKPQDWSLPHWTAYWATGWQMTCTSYCEKIEKVFDTMIRLAPEVLPENSRGVNNYIAAAWSEVMMLVQSIEREQGTEELRSRFESHVAAEEEKLRRNFEGVKYRIDTPDTFRVVAGKGRVERTLFPMLYLALKQDLERVGLARNHVLSEDEMPDALATIRSIIEVAWDRIQSLKCIFGQQNLNSQDQFKVFAKGLYSILNASEFAFSGDRVRELPYRVLYGDEIIPNPDSDPLSVLKHLPGKRHEIDFAAYDPPEFTLSPTDGAHPMLGVYYGFIYECGSPRYPMNKFTFNMGEENTFIATGAHHHPNGSDGYKIIGKWDPPLEDGRFRVKLTYTASWESIEMDGFFDPEENSLKGSGSSTEEFVFKRKPDYVRFYPAPSTTGARKRWEFATTSVLEGVRRKPWSPTYALKRFKDGKRFTELSTRLNYYGRALSEAEVAEFFAFYPILYEADVRFYASLIRIDLNKIPIFSLVRCDNCGSTPGGSRIVCMDCHGETTVDLCSESGCVDSTITFDDSDRGTHSPSHRMFKVHRFIFETEIRNIEYYAGITSSRAQGVLSELKEEGKPMPECIRCEVIISLPCWRCVDCPVNTDEMGLICDNCESKDLAFNTTHTKMHTLVRVSDKGKEKDLPMEERLRIVEDELTRMRKLLAKLVRKGTKRILQ